LSQAPEFRHGNLILESAIQNPLASGFIREDNLNIGKPNQQIE
jgi:hypothetical protein